jgi:hypothetical protein
LLLDCNNYSCCERIARAKAHMRPLRAVTDEPQVAATLQVDKGAIFAGKQQPLAYMPYPLTAAKPDIFIRETPSGGMLCSAMMWHARNMVCGHQATRAGSHLIKRARMHAGLNRGYVHVNSA